MLARRLALAVLVLAACGDGGGAPDAGLASGEIEASACLTATACGISPDDISRCSANVAGVSLAVNAARAGISYALVTCLAEAKADCAAARRCLNAGMTPEPCTPGRSRCEGSVLVGCSSVAGAAGTYGTTRTDCSAFGETCVLVTGTSATCGIAPCTMAPTTCAGDKIQSCDSGIVHQQDCAPYAATCDSTGAPHCRGSGDPCTSSLMNPMRGLRCDGSQLVYCFDNREARLDCAAARLSCLSNVAGEPFACALGNQCTPGAFTASCSAGKLTFCNAGIITTRDCIAAGFNNCEAGGLGRCTR
jgi:hypothetical protein